MSIYFISAIDINAGKTIITGLLGKYLNNKGKNVITMKMAQTGCSGYSEDIEMHRKIMGIPMLKEDMDGETCPYLFKFAASPHLAGDMECVRIDEDYILQAIEQKEMEYEQVLVEGVGGLMVPVNDQLLEVDFIKQNKYQVILVATASLGSVNHTLLSLEVMQNRGIDVYGLIFNHYPVSATEIAEDAARVIRLYLKKYFPNALWGEVPYVKDMDTPPVIDLNEEWFK